MISDHYICTLQQQMQKLGKIKTYAQFVIPASKYALAIILIILFGNLISLTVQLLMGILVITVRYVMTILILIGQTAKDNLTLMALLVMILAISTKLSLKLLIYRSFIKLIYDQQKICSICWEKNGDYFHPYCMNFFHTKDCLNKWVKKSQQNKYPIRCPNCRKPLKLTSRKEIKKSLSLSMINILANKRKRETGFIVAGWLILTILYIY